ncbi:MAG TPA: glycosyltransferase family 4 protein [Candidatus Marinimicrobia bacterium]|nr:glycosyltransferase family 4 protein [Candidatus Neomarinimicrobiota bacterium]HRS51065.1 glycosyltransferase family 4 protein [Candidatus Neomarinimicrobiota bacterium]HRU92572.1 glycosyltransferase family 4 protein [Candidatus Neomarinimicrobiota bacterium]
MKKVLFVSYYWPPAGGATTTRILKFYKYLPEFGWEPIILTVENGDFPFIDPQTLNEVRPDTKIYRARNISLHKLFAKVAKNSQDMFVPFAFTEKNNKGLKSKLSRWVKYNAIPDTRFLWNRFAVKKGLQVIRENDIQLIFSSSPPQTNHCVATELSRKTGIPCVGDMRDPWTDVYWLQTNSQRWQWIHKIDQKIEKRTLNSMSAITTIGPSLVNLFQQKVNKPVYLIHNGFEPINPDITPLKNTKWTITYAGSISIEQDIHAFCKAVEILMQNEKIRENIAIQFIGNFPEFVKQKLQQYSFFETIEFLPYMPADKVKQYLVSSDVLLLFIHVTPEGGVINYKMYDYLATRKPILAYGPTQGDAAKILQRANAGKMFEYDDIANSASYLLDLYAKWEQGEPAVEIDEEYVMTFTRHNLTRKLAEIFDIYCKKP